MCRAIGDDYPNGRICPAYTNPQKVSERNARRRLSYAQSKGEMMSPTLYKNHNTYAQEAIQRLVSDGKETDKLFARETEGGELRWERKRAEKHKEIIQELLQQWKDVPCNGEAVFSGGLGGAGKGTILKKFTDIDQTQYATLNPDDIKEIMAEKGMIPHLDGLTPMEVSPLVHEEASYITGQLSKILSSKKKNIIYDLTMGSYKSTVKKIHNLQQAGYTVIEAVFVDIDPQESHKRANLRHKNGLNRYITKGEGYGGRLLPSNITAQQTPTDPKNRSLNIEVFQRLREEGHFHNYGVFDNNVHGRSPILIESSKHSKEQWGKELVDRTA